jgi:alkaline phosphatase
MEITTMKKITTFLLLSSALLLAMNVNAKKQPPSIIFLIGDGMGVAYTSAYRYYQDDPNTPNAEITIFDELLVGMASSYPHDEHFNVTDSAAAATALALLASIITKSPCTHCWMLPNSKGISRVLP